MAINIRTRDELRQFIDEMSDEEFDDLVDLINTRVDDEDLSADELALIDQARKEFARGETVSADQLRSERKGA